MAGEADAPFLPVGQIFAITPGVSAPTPVQIGGPASGNLISIKAYNGNGAAVVLYGAPTAAACTAASAGGIPTPGSPVPTTGGGAFAIAFGIGEDFVFQAAPAQFYTAVTGTASANMLLQTGLGA